MNTTTVPPREPTREDPEPVGAGGRSGALVARLNSLTGWITGLTVMSACLVVLSAMGPSNLLSDTTATGGDMGAHVWGPAYLRDHLLSDWRLTGWAPDWYAGFPAYRFYMVVPALVIVLLDLVMPYNVAFKLVAVSGVVLMPAAAWFMGRVARLPFPVPALLSLAALEFQFDTNFSIYGGNLASTMAGEFSFSISLSLVLIYVGLLVRGLEDGSRRVSAAVALSLAGLCHLIPVFFALVVTLVVVAIDAISLFGPLVRRAWVLLVLAAGVAWGRGVAVGWSVGAQTVAAGVLVSLLVGAVAVSLLSRRGRIRWWWTVAVGFAAATTSAFWVLPFYANRGLLNDMGWEKLEGGADPTRGYGNNLFQPHETVDGGKIIAVFLAMALVASLVSLVRWDRFGLIWALSASLAGVFFVVMPQTRLWNARILPFWYLGVYVMAALALAWAVRGLARLASLSVAGARAAEPAERSRRFTPDGLAGITMAAATVLVAMALLVHVLQPLRVAVPFAGPSADGASWGLPGLRTSDRTFVDSWARHNFTGLEAKDAYPEYYDLVQRMGEVGEEIGCGRSLWEYESELGRFGTPMALMLLPHFTDGCIGSMEGLYFEASKTVPFHFLMQDELSLAPSRPMRELPYPNRVDLENGVDHLQLMGVRYYLASSAETQAAANAQPDLTLVATSDQWQIFEVADSELVETPAFEPVVDRGLELGGRDWIDPAVAWFLDPLEREVLRSIDGPPEWERIEGGDAPRTPLPPVEVSDIVEREGSISFRVDQTGIPVLVKASWFPNWSASGAEGPWRVTPNLMLVVPTENEVRLDFGRTGIEYVSWFLTLVGVVFLVWLWRRPDPDLAPGPPEDSSSHEDPSDRGVVSVGAVTEGALAAGSVTTDADPGGAVTDAEVTSGVDEPVPGAIVPQGVPARGLLPGSPLADGLLADGLLAEGAAADGVPADGQLADGADPPGPVPGESEAGESGPEEPDGSAGADDVHPPR